MFYSEKKTEDFLEKNKFKIVKRGYACNEKELKNVLRRFNFPIVIKISGEKIIHKNVLGGVRTNIENFSKSLEIFRQLKKIKGFDGVIIQEQLNGEEVLIGVKKTRDFGHAVCVGSGGVDTEKLKDISFRIYPFSKEEARKMISETKISKFLSKEEKKLVEEKIIKVCKLIKKYPKISELDINPLIVNGKQAVIVDARMVID